MAGCWWPRLTALCAMAAAAAFGQPVSSGIVRTVAGGFDPDPGPATESWFEVAADVDVDASGNVYFVDSASHRIRRIDAATGTVTTVAGDGWPGFAGDGGAATKARLSSPSGVAVAPSGNIYVADLGNLRIREVIAGTGVIRTVAGNGEWPWDNPDERTATASGSAVDMPLYVPSRVAAGPSGEVYISGWGGEDRLRRLDPATGVMSTVGDVRPDAVAVAPSGDVYMTRRGLVLRMDAGGGAVQTVATLGLSTWGGDLAVTPSGDLYVSACLGSWTTRALDDRCGRKAFVWRVDALAGSFAAVLDKGGFGGDGGPAMDAKARPRRLAVGPDGDLYLADGINRRIRRIDAATGVISTLAGTGRRAGDGRPATEARLASPQGVAFAPSGDLYIADTGNHRIRRVEAATGRISTVAGTGSRGDAGDGGPALEATLDRPFGVAVAPSGDIVVADTSNNRIRRIDAATGVITTIAGRGGPGGFGGDGGPATEALLARPYDVEVSPSGDVYIADEFNDRVRRVDAATGVITTVAGSDTEGRRFLENPCEGRAPHLREDCLWHPAGIGIAPSGDVYIADSWNGRIVRVDAPTGAVATVAGRRDLLAARPQGEHYIHSPQDVAVSPSGDLYIAHSSYVSRVDAVTGRITTAAGNLTRYFYLPDGAPATHTSFPTTGVEGFHKEGGIAVGPSGDIHITVGQRIRRFAPPNPVPGWTGDMDGDGRDDVLVREPGGRWFLYPMDGSRHIAANAGEPMLPEHGELAFAAIGNFDGQGGDDILLRHWRGSWRGYSMAGGRVDAVHSVALPDQPRRVSLAGVGDFNGDGTDDVLLRTSDGKWSVHPMRGFRVRESPPGHARLPPDFNYRPSAVGDFDGDGRDDVLLRRTDGVWFVFPMYGGGDAGAGVRAGLPADWEWRLAGAGDFDGDGRDDVLVRHWTEGRWRLHRNAGRTWTAVRLTTRPEFHVAAVGDFNGDGRDDVLVRRRTTGHWYYYGLDGPRIANRGWANLPRDRAWTVAGGLR